MMEDLNDGGITIGFGTFIKHGDTESKRFYEEKYNITIKAVSYTHLTLPTNSRV